MPTYYTEYEADLGQALADPVRVFAEGVQEVWTRRFDFGFVVVSSLTDSNYTLRLPTDLSGGVLQRLPLSSRTHRLTDQREAPAWQFVIDNDGHSDSTLALLGRRGVASQSRCVCSAAAPACCPHASGRPQDWWADDGRRAGFRVEGDHPWTVVGDEGQSHQVGDTFLVSFVEPGVLPQGAPPHLEVVYHFVSPMSGAFNFSVTAVRSGYDN